MKISRKKMTDIKFWRLRPPPPPCDTMDWWNRSCFEKSWCNTWFLKLTDELHTVDYLYYRPHPKDGGKVPFLMFVSVHLHPNHWSHVLSGVRTPPPSIILPLIPGPFLGGGYPGQVGSQFRMGRYPSGTTPHRAQFPGQDKGTPLDELRFQVRVGDTPTKVRRGGTQLYPLWGQDALPPDRTTAVLGTRRAVCLLRLRRKTFLSHPAFSFVSKFENERKLFLPRENCDFLKFPSGRFGR